MCLEKKIKSGLRSTQSLQKSREAIYAIDIRAPNFDSNGNQHWLHWNSWWIISVVNKEIGIYLKASNFSLHQSVL